FFRVNAREGLPLLPCEKVRGYRLLFKEIETGHRQPAQKRFNSAPKSDEHCTTGLPGLSKIEVAIQRNDCRIDSAVAAGVHQKENTRPRSESVHLLRRFGRVSQRLRQGSLGR